MSAGGQALPPDFAPREARYTVRPNSLAPVRWIIDCDGKPWVALVNMASGEPAEAAARLLAAFLNSAARCARCGHDFIEAGWSHCPKCDNPF